MFPRPPKEFLTSSKIRIITGPVSARARLLLVNARSTIKPVSVTAYTDPSAKDRAAIANPLFGTTTDYVAALFTLWGDDRTRAFMDDMKKNDTKVTTSN